MSRLILLCEGQVRQVMTTNLRSSSKSPCIMSVQYTGGRGGVQYTGGCSVHRGMFSTPGDIMSTVGDIMSTLGDIMSTLGVFSTPGGYHEYTGGYHEYTGGIS